MAEEPVNALFRPSTRRKTFRKRADDDEDDTPATDREDARGTMEEATLPATTTGEERAGDIAQSRRPGKSRRFGVNFSSAASARPMDQTDHTAIAKVEPVQDAMPAAAGRFTAPTGQAVQKEDKHMWVLPSSTTHKTQ